MSAKQYTGTVRVYNTNGDWKPTSEVLKQCETGEVQRALSGLHLTPTDMTGQPEWALIGEAEVTLRFHSREQLVADELSSLEAALAKERADSMQRQNAIRDRISKLQALEFDGEVST